MFSERLKAIRKERGISQRALAQRLGVSQQAVAKWEAASSTPGPNALATIADVLGVSSDYLLGREHDFQDSAQDTARLPVLGTVKAGYGPMHLRRIMEPRLRRCVIQGIIFI